MGWIVKSAAQCGADYKPLDRLKYLDQDWFRQWLGACSLPSHYLSQCWYFVKSTLMIKHVIRLHRQNLASVQLPQATRSQTGSQSSLSPDSILTWWAYRAISLLFRPGTLPAGGLISPLSSPAFDDDFDHMRLIRVPLIFKMQKALKNKYTVLYWYISEEGALV